MEILLEDQSWLRGAPLVGGEGGFGKVYEVVASDGSTAVAKFVEKAPGALREIFIGESLRAADFRNVVPVIDRGEHEDSWVLVMPRAEKSLAQYLASTSEPLDLPEIVSILSDIATALSDIDGAVVHRDLKPENVLLLDGTWCLADFGIARYAEATTAMDTRKLSLTPPYGAPEQWRNERATSATDIYAFGVIAFQLLAGVLPFRGPDTPSFREQHLTENPPLLTAGTARLRILIEECLYKPQEMRPSAKNVLARLAKAAEEPARPGLTRLAKVSHAEVQRQAKKHAEDAVQREYSERQDRMFSVADRSFASFADPLVQAIQDYAPTAKIDFGSEREHKRFVAELSGARLGISNPQKAKPWQGPFAVVAFAGIAVNLGHRNRMGWEGRSHSLWFCDAHEEGRFAWYEMAFMSSPIGGNHPSVEPYSNSPLEGQVAFQRVIGTTQLAWPVEELDRVDPSEFLDRWLGWFADAAEGRLGRPSRMPEKNTQGSWRS
jgi:serine/threonine-protein kinase